MSTKFSATAQVTGSVAAKTAIGTLNASMLDTATTSSITNSMNVPVPSTTPIGCTRLNIQARPKRRSSVTKRRRHDLMLTSASGVARNCRHFATMRAWMIRTQTVQSAAVVGPVQRPDRKPTRDDQQQHDERGGQPVLREHAHQFIVESRAGAGGRGQPVASVANTLRGNAAPLRGSLLALVARGAGRHSPVLKDSGQTRAKTLRATLNRAP